MNTTFGFSRHRGLFLLLFFSPVLLFSQHFDYTPAGKIDVFLVTVGPGDALYSWWGHTAIVIEDTETGRQRLFDYGLFTFSEDDFVKNFIFGRLWFSVGDSHPRLSLGMWVSEDRDIRFRRMNLSGEMKKKMISLLEKDSEPGNNTYLYDHYFDNCATRERDIIDTVLDGQFKEAHQEPSSSTLRKISRKYMKGHFPMEFLLMFLLGPGSDIPITTWDEMFLPEELEYYISRFSYTHGYGETVKLTEDMTYYTRATVKRPVPQKAPNRILLMLLIGCGSAAILYFLYRRSSKGNGPGRILFTSITGVFTFGFGVMGSLLLFMMFFTDHTITYGNENLLLANPLLLAAFIILFRAFRRNSLRMIFSGIFTFLSLSVVVLMVYKLSTSFDQDNWEFIALFLPLYLVLGPVPWLSSSRDLPFSE